MGQVLRLAAMAIIAPCRREARCRRHYMHPVNQLRQKARKIYPGLTRSITFKPDAGASSGHT